MERGGGEICDGLVIDQPNSNNTGRIIWYIAHALLLILYFKSDSYMIMVVSVMFRTHHILLFFSGSEKLLIACVFTLGLMTCPIDIKCIHWPYLCESDSDYYDCW